MQTINQLTKTMPQLNNPLNPMPNAWQNETGLNLKRSTVQLADKALVAELLDVFELWKAGYQSKMKDQNFNLFTAQVWAVALQQVGVMPHEIGLAYAESIKACHKWLPTDAGEFIALVRGVQASEYPISRPAFQFACENEGRTADIKKPYDHVVIYETVKRLGSYALKNADERYFATWDEVYQQVIAEHKNGADFALPESQQVEHKHFAAEKSVADSYMAKIQAITGNRKATKSEAVA